MNSYGYFKDEERTQDAFKGGWFHSGDLGYFDSDGYLAVVGRKKDMIKTRSENFSSREVEETVCQLDAVSEVAVIALGDPLWVETVTAIVVLRNDQIIDEQTVISHCKSQLASFEVPKKVIFVNSLPRNPSGKILKRNLRELYEQASSGDVISGL